MVPTGRRRMPHSQWNNACTEREVPKLYHLLKRRSQLATPIMGLDTFTFIPLGLSESKVYTNKPATMQQLQDEIIRHIGKIENQLCRDVEVFTIEWRYPADALVDIWVILYFTHNFHESHTWSNIKVNKIRPISLIYLLLASVRLNGTPFAQ